LPADHEKDKDDDNDDREDGVVTGSQLFKDTDNQQQLRDHTSIEEEDAQIVENDVSKVDGNLTEVVNSFADAFNGKVVLSAYEFSTMLDIIQQHVFVTTSSAIELVNYLCSNGWMPNDKRLQVISSLGGSKISLAQMMKVTKHFVTIPE
ncbi:hypothetical protein D918_05684, partial [Trichuris suis]